MYPEASSDQVFEQSQLPTPPEKVTESLDFHSVDVSVDKALISNLGEVYDSSLTSVQTAWAILLRTFLRDDSVTFAILSNGDYNIWESSYHQRFTRKADTRSWILQYCISGQSQIKDVRPSIFPVYDGRLIENTQTSSAICLSSPSSSNRLWSEDFHLTDNLLQRQLTDKVSLISLIELFIFLDQLVTEWCLYNRIRLRCNSCQYELLKAGN